MCACLPACCSFYLPLPTLLAQPCSEIILRPYQFCNLTEVIIREHDDIASLKRKARLATILGTFQVRIVFVFCYFDVLLHNCCVCRVC
jgi:hypothetical protein